MYIYTYIQYYKHIYNILNIYIYIYPGRLPRYIAYCLLPDRIPRVSARTSPAPTEHASGGRHGGLAFREDPLSPREGTKVRQHKWYITPHWIPLLLKYVSLYMNYSILYIYIYIDVKCSILYRI